MIITAVTMAAIMVCFLLIFWSNKLVKFVSMYFIIISLFILTGTAYLSKSFQPKYMLDTEQQIYQIMNMIKLPLSTLVRTFNLSVFVYMIMSVVLIKQLSHAKWYKVIWLLIPCLYIFVYADPEVARRLLVLNEIGMRNSEFFWDNFINANNWLCRAILIVYMILPILFVLNKAKRAVIFVNRKDMLMLGMCLLVINLYVYFMLIEGMFKSIMFYNVNMARLPDAMDFPSGYITSIVLWFIIAFFLLIVLFFRPYWVHEPTNRFLFGLRWKYINKNLSMNLHSYKNAFFGVSQQCRIAANNIRNGEYEKAMERVLLGQKIANEHIENISNTIDLLGSVNVKFTVIDLKECINKALEKAGSENEGKIESSINCTRESVFVRGDKRHLTECIFNIILNAEEALMAKDGENPHIHIRIIAEDELVQVEFEDNGTGIMYKHINKIFRPFSSTKTQSHSGVGLNYVSNVIRQHHGEIRVKSVRGEYTLFQIVLPMCGEKSRKKQERKDRRKLWEVKLK